MIHDYAHCFVGSSPNVFLNHVFPISQVLRQRDRQAVLEQTMARHKEVTMAAISSQQDRMQPPGTKANRKDCKLWVGELPTSCGMYAVCKNSIYSMTIEVLLIWWLAISLIVLNDGWWILIENFRLFIINQGESILSTILGENKSPPRNSFLAMFAALVWGSIQCTVGLLEKLPALPQPMLRVRFYNAVCMAEMLPADLTPYDFERKLMTRLRTLWKETREKSNWNTMRIYRRNGEFSSVMGVDGHHCAWDDLSTCSYTKNRFQNTIFPAKLS